jgi:hypothetical protein
MLTKCLKQIYFKQGNTQNEEGDNEIMIKMEKAIEVYLNY